VHVAARSYSQLTERCQKIVVNRFPCRWTSIKDGYIDIAIRACSAVRYGTEQDRGREARIALQLSY
jgi:hypothetical protein